MLLNKPNNTLLIISIRNLQHIILDIILKPFIVYYLKQSAQSSSAQIWSFIMLVFGDQAKTADRYE